MSALLSPHVLRRSLTLVFRGLVVMLGVNLAACSTQSAPSAPPTEFVGGIHSHEFSWIAPAVCSSNCIDSRTTYTGEWLDNVPHGKGEATNSFHFTCRGEFGLDPTRIPGLDPMRELQLRQYEGGNDEYARKYLTLAKGEVYLNGNLYFAGVFLNNFYYGESCLPYGPGTWTSGSGATITATRKLRLDRHTRTFSNYIGIGACRIERKDGLTYVGTCGVAPEFRGFPDEIALDAMEDEYQHDPFSIATSDGTFFDLHGKPLSRSAVAAVNADIQHYREERKAARQKAAEEARQQELAADAQKRRESATNRQGLVAIGGAMALGHAMEGTSYTGEQKSSVVNAYVQDVMEGGQGTSHLDAAADAETSARHASQGRPGSGTGKATVVAPTSDPATCPTSGDPVKVGNIGDIPRICTNGRQQNYAYSEAEGVSLKDVCDTARNGDNIRQANGRNVSVCYCAEHAFKQNGDIKPMTCWVFYDGQ
ncbi:MAG TPA: hypothetical protein VFM34_04935 [Moraxellaceae bacterium]|nr:hypothetical protein [Moraxellaceae bacterium]